MMALMLCAFAGRLTLSICADRFGRRITGVFCSFGAAAALSVAAYSAPLDAGAAFLPLLMAAYFFGEGGFAVLAPYSAEVWPAALRTSGLGSAYGFGGVGKIIGPLGLALVIGSSNLVLPKTTSEAITPAFLYFAAWYVLAGLAYLAFGIETKGRSLEAISDQLKMDKRPPPMTDQERFVL
jgi:putative MFS transporter